MGEDESSGKLFSLYLTPLHKQHKHEERRRQRVYAWTAGKGGPKAGAGVGVYGGKLWWDARETRATKLLDMALYRTRYPHASHYLYIIERQWRCAHKHAAYGLQGNRNTRSG